MTTARRTLVASLGVALALAASTAGNTACEVQCSLPTERIDLKFPPPLESACFKGLDIGAFEGVVHNDGTTLVLTIGTEDLPFAELDAGIPDGTFVRLSFLCQTIPQFEQGRLLVIENLPALGGVANPTEGGTRLWHLVAAGGSLLIFSALPVDYALEQVCEVDNDEDGRFDVESLIIADGNKAVIVPPGETRDVTLTRGPHAGKYSVQNVNITFGDNTTAGSDFPIAVNFRIRRAD